MSDTVTDAAATAFAADMQARGLDPAPALARFGRGADGRFVTQQTPTTPATPSDRSPPQIPAFNARELETAAATLSQHWTGDREVLRAALQKAGLTEVDDVDDTRTPAQRQIDTAFPSGNAAEYDLQGVYVGRAGDVSELVRTDGEMRQMLAALNYPRVAARSLVSDLLDAAAGGYATLTSDAAKGQYSNEQVALAIQATHAVSRADLFATAKLATDRIPPAIAEKLALQGVFEDRRVLSALYMQGQRIAAYRRG